MRPFTTLWIVAHQALCSRDSPGKNTGVDCHSLLQGIFPTQKPNSCLNISYKQVGSLPLAVYICYNAYIYILKLVNISLKTFVKSHKVVNLNLVNLKLCKLHLKRAYLRKGASGSSLVA